ncbi:double-stranded RNA-binding protein 1-like [Rhodamnia argentea]|uniref:Double-stranded RNA-binding protein 1-like n=1 Tax=Rhodamnia argentea TaxID=178133 RepID=A0A8B8P1W6_9MYRT|nr:double-stranded RNA-binding protein 1-like [Rhodamnia argentea]
MPANDGFSGVSNCYVFKSRLQEYAQKVGRPTPVYETIKEGPSHEPSFRSTVIVNDVRYDSLPGFFNRKAAEQSAAGVALLELSKSGEISDSISQPVHETGLCKNLLQEYAQKMNYAIPLYECRKDEAPGRVPHFSCTVEIGGIRYIGASARTKKEAEIKAARTALLAIQSSTSNSCEKLITDSQLTVVPCKKRGTEMVTNADDTGNPPKAKKPRFKKKSLKRKLSADKLGNNQIQNMGNSNLGINESVPSGVSEDASGLLARDLGLNPNGNENERCVDIARVNSINFQNLQCLPSNFNQGNLGTQGTLLVPCGDASALLRETSKISGVNEGASATNNCSGCANMENLGGIVGFDKSKGSV